MTGAAISRFAMALQPGRGGGTFGKVDDGADEALVRRRRHQPRNEGVHGRVRRALVEFVRMPWRRAPGTRCDRGSRRRGGCGFAENAKVGGHLADGAHKRAAEPAQRLAVPRLGGRSRRRQQESCASELAGSDDAERAVFGVHRCAAAPASPRSARCRYSVRGGALVSYQHCHMHRTGIDDKAARTGCGGDDLQALRHGVVW